MLGRAIDGTPDPAWANLVPVVVPNGNSTVQEMRYETFANHNWQINDRMSLESAVIVETSTIEQSGDVSNPATFSFSGLVSTTVLTYAQPATARRAEKRR